MRSPDLASPVAKAWHLKRGNNATISAWFVNGPFHPHWNWWYVGCITLEDVEGMAPAFKESPGNEYQFDIISINPEQEVDIEAIEAGAPVSYLSPPDVQVQFRGIDRDSVVGMTQIAVATILAGKSPDSDNRSWWITTILTSVEHARTGGLEMAEGKA